MKFLTGKRTIEESRKAIAEYFSIIDYSRCQFHQHFTRSFLVQRFRAKLFLYLHNRLELFRRKNIGSKAAHKILAKLTTVNPSSEEGGKRGNKMLNIFLT
jgi:hypothetical protein